MLLGLPLEVREYAQKSSPKPPLEAIAIIGIQKHYLIIGIFLYE